MPRLNGGIPAQVGRRVRIAACDGCTPAAGHSAAVCVRPIDSPAIDCRGAIIFNANRRCETITPLVGNHIRTITACTRT